MKPRCPGGLKLREWKCRADDARIMFKSHICSKDARLPVMLQRAMAAEAEARDANERHVPEFGMGITRTGSYNPHVGPNGSE